MRTVYTYAHGTRLTLQSHTVVSHAVRMCIPLCEKDHLNSCHREVMVNLDRLAGQVLPDQG